MRHGFVYLVAVLDWFSRNVEAWQLSNTLDGYFCVEALQQVLDRGTPAIFNTDQGVQFVASNFASHLCFYNHDRPHQSLQYRTPVEVLFA